MKTDDELFTISYQSVNDEEERRALYNAGVADGLRDAAEVCNAVALAYQGVEALSAKHCHDSMLALIEEGR